MTGEECAEFVPWYWKSLDFDALTREFPPPPDYFKTTFRLSRDELRAIQEKRFLQTVARGWEIPFFQRHWGGAGLERGAAREPATSPAPSAIAAASYRPSEQP